MGVVGRLVSHALRVQELGRSGVETATCGRPGCTARVALHSGARDSRPWATRQASSFEDTPVCSRDCLQGMVARALRRELAGAAQPVEPYAHRLPLGLLMLSRQWITREQLAGALARQRKAGEGRLGDWLVRTQGVSEQAVSSALAAQWGTPVLTLDAHHDIRVARLLPRLFIELFDAVPLRVAARRILYLAIHEGVDRCLNQALESMTGLRVEAGVLQPSAYQALRQAALEDVATPARLFSCASLESLEDSISSFIAESGPVASRLVRMKHCIWLRTERLEPGAGLARHSEDAIFALPSPR